VLDEDEFARTLIPELFKHNNYASFVRQLNMYGFHKKVGLSDNSMKASETKAKAPSEYYNKYFKRGRQELLWLIQKPKNPPAGPKRKRDEDNKGDSDEDRKYIQDTGGGGYVEEVAVRRTEQMAMIPRSEYNSLRVEVRELQQQQKLISNVLTQIKRQNEELYSRATSFQALHDRHENSINAILTFLATFYNRSLEGQANGMNLADMFPAARQQPHGNVVDVDDFPMQESHKSPQLQRKKQPLAILPAPPNQQELLSPMATGRATTVSPTTRPLASPITRPGSRQSVFRPTGSLHRQQSQTQSPFPAPQGRDSMSAGPIKEESPSNFTPLPENDAIMSAIQNANASAGQSTNPPADFDYAAALSNYQTADGHVPLTPQQRNDVLSQIVNQTSAQNTNNALTNPNPPEVSRLLNDLAQYQATQQQLEMLQKLSDQQNSKIQNIHDRILPLSPTGQIAGIGGHQATGAGGGGYFDVGEPGQYDLNMDDFTQDDDFFPNDTSTVNGLQNNSNTNGGLPDFNFETGTPFEGGDAFTFGDDTGHLVVGGAGVEEGGRVESVGSSNVTSPAATVEEVEDESRKRSPKMRRK
jgi:heat shock transcription factor